ncbi:MAG: hypothetical protein MUQ26_00845 [Armatimonadetes bacterium]|nr:hypothetical protein [Armatimonadota bacterium]
MSPAKAPKKAKKAAKKSAPAKAAAKKRAPVQAAAKASGRGEAGATKPTIRPLPIYEFEAGGLQGYVRLADPQRGIEFSGCREGKHLPGACTEVLSLRHYLARGEGGLLIPREEATCDGSVDKHGVVFKYGPAAKWPIDATARYELLPEGGVDVTLAFTLAKGLKGFEAGVETLTSRTQANIHVHTGGKWTAATAGPRLQRFYPRNMGVRELIADGRWNGLRMAGIGLAVEPQGYDYPLAVAWEPNTKWALAYMALTEECSSIWVNGADNALGLGLVGADIKAKSATTCRVRALLCQVTDLDDVLPHYRDFVREARTTRKH